MIDELQFEDLQKRKVALASSLLKKLEGANARLAAAEESGKAHLVESWLKVFSESLSDLRNLVKTEQMGCAKGTNCVALLDEEIAGLSDAIGHIGQVIKGVHLEESKLSSVLILIVSRQHSLPALLKAA